MITVNMNKAREIHKGFIREARKSLFESLDVEYMLALEQNKDTSEIVSKKQELRDLTKHPDIASAKNINQLKRFWPDILGEKPF